MSEPTTERALGLWLQGLASDAPTPGGGPAAAVVAAAGAALISMVGRLTVGRERYADVEPRMREIVDRADDERGRFLDLADRDAEAFERFMEAFRLARETEDERSERAAAIEDASIAAADVPLEVARRSVGLMELAVEVAARGNPHAALASVRINAGSMTDPATAARYLEQARSLRDRAGRLLVEADEAFASRLPS